MQQIQLFIPGLKKHILINETKIVADFSDGTGEDSLFGGSAAAPASGRAGRIVRCAR